MFLGFNKSNLANITKSPQYILLIDDNIKLRSMLARYILLNCSQHQQSCTLYQLNDTGEPIFTYSHDPAIEVAANEQPETTVSEAGQSSNRNMVESDFIIYEATFPRQAVAWLNRFQAEAMNGTPSLPKRLTVISDVMMPGDTQVGLGGLLTTLAQRHILVNLLFMSVEPQGYWVAKNLLGGVKPYFLVKGSANFNRLPQALVEGAHRFTYQFLPSQTYPNFLAIEAA